MSAGYGIPVNAGPAGAPEIMTWTAKYGPTESDELACPGGAGDFCYPIPLTSNIEGGPSAKATSDRHLLFLATDGAPAHCTLYEVYNAQNPGTSGGTASNGAIWHLDTNALRPEGWTSADAAGLAVMPGLVRYDEVKAGVITHAIRFTMDVTQNGYIHPATHAAGDTDPTYPPMGLRVRLEASFDDGAFSASTKVVTAAMKKYGLLLADNGTSWYIGGESNDAWAPEMDALLADLKKVHGSDFEIVKTGDIIPQPN